MSDAVLGAVLVGGASRRMGADKASLPLDGMPMAHRARRTLFDGGCGAVVLVGSADEGGVPDRWPGEGPLGGLATAVGHGAAAEGIEVVVVVACDQPDLAPALIAALAHALLSGPGDAVVCAVRTPDGRLQPFPSAWRTSSGAALAALVEAGERRADAGFAAGRLLEVVASQELLADVDTPADVQSWEERHRADPEPPGHHR